MVNCIHIVIIVLILDQEVSAIIFSLLPHIVTHNLRAHR